MFRRSSTPTQPTGNESNGSPAGGSQPASNIEADRAHLQRAATTAPSDRLKYTTVREAVTNEKDLMKLMVELSEPEFNQLMNASDAYVRALQSSQKHQQDMAAHEERKSRLDNQKRQQELDMHRQEQEAENKLKQMRARGEELRQNERVKTEEAKRRIDYEQEKTTQEEIKREKLRLETRREFDRLDVEKKQAEEALEQKRFQRERDLMNAKLSERARLKRETEVELGNFRLEQSLKEHRAKKDDELLKAKELRKIEVDADVQKESVRWDKLSNFFSGDEGKARMWNVGGLVAGSLGALYFFKTVQPLAERGLRNYFFKPTLVSRAVTHHNSWIGGIVHRSTSMFSKPKPVPDVILEPHLQAKMNGIIEGTRTASKRNGYFGGMMLYGRPGTGKTLFAETLARESGMDFAVMSGPSFEQFTPQEAIVEVKNLFKWANKSKHGLLLFVDEADSFLEDRSTLNPARVSVLNEWLNQTGTESRKFMCVYETNRPEVLDPAVQSRIARSIEMPPPGEKEIQRMLEQYIDLYVLQENNIKSGKGQTTPIIISTKATAPTTTTTTTTTSSSTTTTQPPPETPQMSPAETEAARQMQARESERHARSERLRTEYGIDLAAHAKSLSAAGFVGRDVSNLCISLVQALYAQGGDTAKGSASASAGGVQLTPELVARVVDEQIAKKQQENVYIASRKARIQAMGKFDSLHM
eukprot:TRINITY_DN2511_c1_g2_i1.p1 TRINITY_DN2511_c1_g2~~TRINITY_DN2511_c1_g2_i1.p1  ORF type:complete len:712 (-),score=196.40 TRINITY_DN2511_c1_g2_i1:26-2128(-)